MQTGEDIQGLRKILDLTRLLSVALLAVHLNLVGYRLFQARGLTSHMTDIFLLHLSGMAIFHSMLGTKVLIFTCLAISLLGNTGRKSDGIKIAYPMAMLAIGIPVFLFGHLFVGTLQNFFYTVLTSISYLLILAGGTRITRWMKGHLADDVFNAENETFPQEERLLENEYSINMPAKYRLKKKYRKSWVNIINPFRGILVAGTPGAGKSYFVIRHIIDQHLKKGFSMFIYDFKFDDLSKLAYNKLLKYRNRFTVVPKFYVINFDDLSRTHRCNPLAPESMTDITDAIEASKTIMLGLNRDWIKKQGDFFVESPINFLTAVIWFLKQFEGGKYCTLPHVIELMQAEYDQLFPLLDSCSEIRSLINPFISAWRNNANAQLEGQIASAKIGLARLSSPQLYYVLSGNDFSLDINDPEAPKVVCMGNNPQKLQVYGAVLSLFIAKMVKQVNQKHKLKSSLIFDEFPTIYFNNIDSLIATARSNKVATTLAVQDFSQLKKDYAAEQADVITGIVGNIISGQVTGDTAKKLSESFGKIMQEKQSRNISSSDTSISQSTQMDYAIPASKIAKLSSGEFVGVVADNPEQKIQLKMFHSEIQNNHETISREDRRMVPIPVIKQVSLEDINANYQRIRMEVGHFFEVSQTNNLPPEDARKPDEIGADQAISL